MAKETCSLLKCSGDPNAKDDAIFEFAVVAGAPFIKLGHRKGGYQQIRGFQGFNINVVIARDNTRKYEYSTTKNVEGDEDAAHRPLIFAVSGQSRVLSAFLPDTDFNREKLAKGYYYLDVTIMDPDVDKKIKKRADAIVDATPTGPTEAEIIVDQQKQIKELGEHLNNALRRENVLLMKFKPNNKCT